MGRDGSRLMEPVAPLLPGRTCLTQGVGAGPSGSYVSGRHRHVPGGFRVG